MANKKSRLRIQLAPSAKISLRTHASAPAAVNHEKPQDEEEATTNEFSVGMILRSCLASVDAMLPEVEDHRVDTKTEIPDFNVKFKGCLAAVGATIESVPGKDFNAKSDTSESLTHLSDVGTSQLAQDDARDEIPVVANRKPGRPKKVLPNTSSSVGGKTSEPSVESMKAQETTREKQPETPPTRALRDRAAKSDAAERSAQQISSSKTETQDIEASGDAKKRGGSKKNVTKPAPTSPSAETPSRDDRKQALTGASGSEETQDKPEASEILEVKRGRGRKKAVPVEEPAADKTEETPAGPRRGRKRTRTGSEGIPEVADADVAAKTAAPQKQDESPEGDATNTEADDETKDPQGGLRKKRGRFRGGRSPKGESDIEAATIPKTPESGVSNNKQPETAAPAVIAVRKSLRAAEDSDSADTVIEETDKVKRRGRPPSTDESRSAKPHQKTVTLRGRGKKTVLKVALPIRARSTRSQAEKPGENLPAEDPVAVSRTSKFSLPPPPPPALAASRSPSPKISSPRSSARTVRVTTKKKPQRNSHASDTDTAEETLDQEEFLRQKEKLESGPTATSTPSTSHQVSTIPVHAESAKALPSTPITTTAKLDEPAGKKQKIITVGNIASAKDAQDPVKVGLFDAPAVIVEGKRERKRKVMSEFADPNAVLELAPTITKSQQPVVSQQPTTKPNPVATSVTVTTTARSTPSAVTVKPMVTIVNPTMANKPNITLVPPSQPGCSYLQSGLKPIVITVPPTRTTSGSTLPGVTKTIVLPKVLARPIAQNINQQQRQQSPSSQSTQLHHQPQIRSIRLSSSMASTPAQRSTTTIISRPPPQRVLPSPIRTSGIQTTPTSSSVVIRTIGPGTLNAPRLMTSGGIRPSIIRSPRIVTSLPGGVRPRLMSTFSSASGARIVTVRPSVSGTTVQTIRTTVPGQPNKVFLRTVAPIIPQRHITVQATPSQPTVRTMTEPAGSRPVSAAMVIRSPPKIVVKPSEATVTKQSSTTVKKVAQQIVRPTERKAVPPPPPAKKAAVQPRKVVNVARVAPETVQPTSSVMDKLLEEPQLPKVGKKPLSKKQRSMRKTDLIKTSTRSRRRGTDLQINYNEDRLSKITTDDDSDSQEEVQTSPEELGSPDEAQRTEENDEQEPQDDIPVAVVEVFLSQDEVKLREVHSPTKQDLVDLNRQPVEQPMEVALGGQGAPEGFFTSEEGLVETVDVPFEGAAIEAMKAGLVSTNDNAFAKSLMLGDDALLRKKVSKRKSNPLAKD